MMWNGVSMSAATSKNVLTGRSARFQFAPASVVIRNPLSFPLNMNFGFFGSIHSAWLSPPGLPPRPPPAAPAPPAPAPPVADGGAGRNAPNVLPPSDDDTAWNDSR